VLYTLRERAIEHAVLPWCENYGVALTADSPFGHGNFLSLHASEVRAPVDIAGAHGTTPRQVALSFLTRRPSVFTIPKASIPQHTEENAGAGDLKLTKNEIVRIDHVCPRGPLPDRLPMI
jgi:diketogulonate reductase-like aldo/keto reductase